MHVNFAPKLHPFPLPLLALNAGYLKLTRTDYEPNRWPFYQFVCCYQGHGTFHTENGVHRLSPGTMLLIKPGCVHRYAKEDEMCYLSWVSFEGALIGQLYADCGLSADAAYAIVHDRTHPALHLEIMSVFEQVDDPFALGRISAILYKIAIEYLLQMQANTGSGRSADKPDPIAAAVDWMKRHVQVPVDIARLAQEQGMSRQHLNRLFRHKFGITTHEYYRGLKIAQAQKDLAELSDKPVKEIASGLGYVSASHFIDVFRKATGMTPVAFRASVMRRQ
ncbi:AraC family transcriptional regulator [Cohnella silvisoli]|uniref:AraC family transcriptional regulator n=1 Tax=Cohnella silvisoli TaxID=2873699 RepID=A0ABV1L3V7_9BACL|nr:AraC family transcriptional regulator [Cohnella silvisoli]MCD9021591.1 AraC family transcriptional regulator [Cohnella silvisoli]